MKKKKKRIRKQKKWKCQGLNATEVKKKKTLTDIILMAGRRHKKAVPITTYKQKTVRETL